MDMLANEWDAEELSDWGLNVPEFPDPDALVAGGGDDKREQENKSQVIIASVSLFGQTDNTIVCEQLTQEQANKLLAVIKSDGAGKIIERLVQ